VVAAAHVDRELLSELDAELNQARRSHRLPSTYAFKYSGSRPVIRESFYSAVSRTSFDVTVLATDKTNWDPSEYSSTTGRLRIARAVSSVLCIAPEHYISGQRVLIDLPASEGRFVQEVRQEIRAALRRHGRESIRALKPVPDHRSEGAIIQLADFAAGLILDEVTGRRVTVPVEFRTRIRRIFG
jgi:hypothetical protein